MKLNLFPAGLSFISGMNQRLQHIHILHILVHILALFRFENFGDMRKPLIVHQHSESRQPDSSSPDMLVPVNAGTQFFLRIVGVNRNQPV
jgi:hypothetical protein